MARSWISFCAAGIALGELAQLVQLVQPLIDHALRVCGILADLRGVRVPGRAVLLPAGIDVEVGRVIAAAAPQLSIGQISAALTVGNLSSTIAALTASSLIALLPLSLSGLPLLPLLTLPLALLSLTLPRAVLDPADPLPAVPDPAAASLLPCLACWPGCVPAPRPAVGRRLSIWLRNRST